jgi:hypothetical protein
VNHIDVARIINAPSDNYLYWYKLSTHLVVFK